MTKLLDEAIKQVRSLPDERQNQVAGVLLSIAKQNLPTLSDEHVAGVHEAIAEANAGKLVDKAEIDKVFTKHLA